MSVVTLKISQGLSVVALWWWYNHYEHDAVLKQCVAQSSTVPLEDEITVGLSSQ